MGQKTLSETLVLTIGMRAMNNSQKKVALRAATGACELAVKDQTAARQGVLRALNALIGHGQVLRRPSRRGVRIAAIYPWKSAT
jgi:hypothetical protein